jgi:hypothetical protein
MVLTNRTPFDLVASNADTPLLRRIRTETLQYRFRGRQPWLQ